MSLQNYVGLVYCMKAISLHHVQEWFRFHRPDLMAWLAETKLGNWSFDWELDSFEYDSSVSYYKVWIVYDDQDAAVLHRLRWGT